MGVYVGIDVSKDRLDVHILPRDEAFFVERSGKGLAELVERLRPLAPNLIAVEATGGFETTTAAALAGAGLPLAVMRVSVTPCKKVSVSLPLRRRLACLLIFHLRFWTNCLAAA